METLPKNKGTYTEKTKISTDKWRKINREHFNAVCRKASALYYEKNREKKNRANLERYYKKKA